MTKSEHQHHHARGSNTPEVSPPTLPALLGRYGCSTKIAQKFLDRIQKADLQRDLSRVLVAIDKTPIKDNPNPLKLRVTAEEAFLNALLDTVYSVGSPLFPSLGSGNQFELEESLSRMLLCIADGALRSKPRQRNVLVSIAAAEIRRTSPQEADQLLAGSLKPRSAEATAQLGSSASKTWLDAVRVLRSLVPHELKLLRTEPYSAICGPGFGALLLLAPKQGEIRLGEKHKNSKIPPLAQGIFDQRSVSNLNDQLSLEDHHHYLQVLRNIVRERAPRLQSFGKGLRLAQNLSREVEKRARADSWQIASKDPSVIPKRRDYLLSCWGRDAASASPSAAVAPRGCLQWQDVEKLEQLEREQREQKIGNTKFLTQFVGASIFRRLEAINSTNQQASGGLDARALLDSLSVSLWLEVAYSPLMRELDVSALNSLTLTRQLARIRKLADTSSVSPAVVIRTISSLFSYAKLAGSYLHQHHDPADLLAVILDFMEEVEPRTLPWAFLQYLSCRIAERSSRYPGTGYQLFPPDPSELAKSCEPLSHHFSKENGAPLRTESTTNFVQRWKMLKALFIDDPSFQSKNIDPREPLTFEAMMCAVGALSPRFLPIQVIPSCRKYSPFGDSGVSDIQVYDFFEIPTLRDILKIDELSPLHQGVASSPRATTLQRRIGRLFGSADWDRMPSAQHAVSFTKSFVLTPAPSYERSPRQTKTLLKLIDTKAQHIIEGLMTPPDLLFPRIHGALIEKVREQVAVAALQEGASQLEDNLRAILSVVENADSPRMLLDLLGKREYTRLQGLNSFDELFSKLFSLVVRSDIELFGIEKWDSRSLPEKIECFERVVEDIQLNVEALHHVRGVGSGFRRAFHVGNFKSLGLFSDRKSLGDAESYEVRASVLHGPVERIVGFLMDTCATEQTVSFKKGFPLMDVFFLSASTPGRERLPAGAFGLIWTRLSDGTPAALLRAFNPNRRLIDAVGARTLFEALVDEVVVPYLRPLNIQVVLVPDEAENPGTLSNSLRVKEHVFDEYGSGSLRLLLAPGEDVDTVFNNYPVSAPCIVVRDTRAETS